MKPSLRDIKGSERKHAFVNQFRIPFNLFVLKKSLLPKYVDRRVGDILDETDQSHVSVGFEDLLLAAHNVGGDLVDLQPGDDAGGRVVRGLAEIVSPVR